MGLGLGLGATGLHRPIFQPRTRSVLPCPAQIISLHRAVANRLCSYFALENIAALQFASTWSRVEKGSPYIRSACWPPFPMMPSSWFSYFQYSPVSFAPTGLVNLAESSWFWTSELHRKWHLLLICMSTTHLLNVWREDGGETTKHLTLNVFTSPCEWDHHRDTEGVKKWFRDDITDMRGRRLSQFGHRGEVMAKSGLVLLKVLAAPGLG